MSARLDGERGVAAAGRGRAQLRLERGLRGAGGRGLGGGAAGVLLPHLLQEEGGQDQGQEEVHQAQHRGQHRDDLR